MTNWLLDTLTVSEFRKMERADRQFLAWEKTLSGLDTCISVITLNEISYGIHLVAARDPKFATQLRDWYRNQLVKQFSERLLIVDIAIAEAVTEFNRGQRENAERDEVQRLGFLAHELRNALTSATLAYQLIKTGKVGADGSTSRILERAHTRMRDIIDRSLVEVRLRNEPTVQYQRCRVINLLSEVEATASFEASAKAIEVRVEAAPELEILTDRHLIISALSNLVQNAIKFTKPGGIVWIRSKAVGERVLLEIEDQCEGLPPGKAEELFEPFSQMGTDKSGLGLGLTISRRAVSLNKGILSVRDVPHQGCVFSIDLPLASISSEKG